MRRVQAALAAVAIAGSLAGCAAGGQAAGPGSPAATRTHSSPAPVPLRPAGNPPGSWLLRLDDEFSGGSLNPAHWSTGWLANGITSPVNTSELECYDPAQVRQSNGTLQLSLTARRESCSGTRPYASGMINSDSKFEFTYGFLEARLWLPGQGRQILNWPAFWADGQNWPKDGEIDVVEGLGGKACWHFVYPAATPGGCAPGEFAGGWHTFGADWEPGVITYYYDGRVVGEVKSGVTAAPMYLILNLATSHKFGGPVSVPSTMRVDYVRVWQHPGQATRRGVAE